LLAACLLAANPAAAAETIAVMPLELSSGLDVGRADLEAAVQRGLAVAGRAIVDPGARPTYVVTGSVTRDGANFRVGFRLVRSADNAVLSTQQNHCEASLCSVAELARRSARELVRQTLGRPGEATPPPPPPPPAAVTAPPISAPPPAAVATTPPPPDEAPPARSKLFPAIGLAASALLVGTGVYLTVVDSRCTSDPPGDRTCPRLNDTRAGGIAAIAGGAVLGAVSIYFLAFDSRGRSVALGLTPTGLTAAGRF
jgi:hypothetical protein